MRRGRKGTREAEVCFIIVLLAMNPKALKADDLPSKAGYIINVGSPDRNPNGIDTWVQDPDAEKYWRRSGARLGGISAWHRPSDSGLDCWLKNDATGISRIASKSDLSPEPKPPQAAPLRA